MMQLEVKRPKRFRPFLRRFLVSYLIILIIPILLNILIFNASTGVVEDYIQNANLSVVSQAGISLDQRIDNLRNLVLRIGLNRRLDYLSNTSPHLYPEFHLDMGRIIKDLKPLFLVDDMVTDVYIYMANNGYVISEDTLIPENIFFKYTFKYGDWDKGQWHDFLLSRFHNCSALPADNVLSGSQMYKAVMIVWSIPFQFNSGNHTFIIFLIDEDALFNYFKPLSSEWDGFLSMYNKEGELIITSFPANRRTHPDDYIDVTISSQQYALMYKLWLPANEVNKRLVFIRKLMFQLTIAALLFGGIAAIYFSSLNARPLRSLFLMLSAQDQGHRSVKKPYDFLNKSVQEIMASNENLRDRLIEQKEVIRENYHYRLLKEGFETRREMNVLRSYLSLTEPIGLHGVALLNFLIDQEIVNYQTLEETKGIKLMLLDNIKMQSRDSNSWIDIGDNSIALVFGIWGNDLDQWNEGILNEIKNIRAGITDSLPFQTFWTVGNPVSDIINLHLSYQQAREVMRVLPRDERTGVYWYRDFVPGQMEYYLPMELLQRLNNLCRSGDFDTASTLFRENWDENFKSRSLTPKIIEQFLSDIRGLLIRLDPALIDDDYLLNTGTTEPERVKDRILEAMHSICLRANNEKKSHNERLKDNILAYIGKNYHDIHLSLYTVASHFNISEGYLSHFFKKHHGAKFYTYIEGLRLGRAAGRLLDSEDCIKEIACASGYSSEYTFRRAFKRVYGVSPSAYRETNRGI